MSEKIVIIGGGAAGPKVAAKLRRENKDIEIDLYTQEDIISFSACGFPYYIGNIIPSIDKLIIRTVSDFKKENINIHTKCRCTNIDTTKNEIEIEDLNTQKRKLISYNTLVIATGATPIIPSIKGVTLKNIFTLRTVKNAIDIKEKATTSKHCVILGGGYIGIELLEAFIRNNLSITLIEKENQILKMFDKDIENMILKQILDTYPNQIKILENEEIIEFIGDTNNNIKQVKTKSNKLIDTDFVILATGIKPNTDFIKNTNIKLGINNSIKVDNTMKTSTNNVYAAGDCCEKYNLVTNKSTWSPMGSTANKEGRCVAINIAGGDCIFNGILNSTITNFFDFTISSVGITYKEAINLGYNADFVIVTKKDKASYMPDSKFITIKLIINKNSHTILGMQCIGDGNVNQRINTIIPFILNGIKIDNITDFDLPYSPPNSPSIDPILNAIQILYKKIKAEE